MSRYGEKTRPGEAVKDFGQKSSGGGGGGRNLGEEIFTASATWTCPPTVTSVEVVLVSGGGGGGGVGASPTSDYFGGGGGGGGVAHAIIPVSGPAPVVVGAGGAGGAYTGPDTSPGSNYNPFLPGSVGGTSSFGSPTSPVFFKVEGGGAGMGGGLNPAGDWSDGSIDSGWAPAEGGSAGSGGYPGQGSPSGPSNNAYWTLIRAGGRFGNPSTAGGNWQSGGGGVGDSKYRGGTDGVYIDTLDGSVGWVGGGAAWGGNGTAGQNAGQSGEYYTGDASGSQFYGCSHGVAAVANKGGGGFGGRWRPAFPAPASPEAPGQSPPVPSGGGDGGAGGSGVVIVRYWE